MIFFCLRLRLRFGRGNFEPIEQAGDEASFPLNVFAQDLDAILRRRHLMGREMLLEFRKRRQKRRQGSPEFMTRRGQQLVIRFRLSFRAQQLIVYREPLFLARDLQDSGNESAQDKQSGD